MGQTPQEQGGTPMRQSLYAQARRRQVESFAINEEEFALQGDHLQLEGHHHGDHNRIDRRQGIYVSASPEDSSAGRVSESESKAYGATNGYAKSADTVPVVAEVKQQILPPPLAPQELSQLQAQLRGELVRSDGANGNGHRESQAAALRMLREHGTRRAFRHTKVSSRVLPRPEIADEKLDAKNETTTEQSEEPASTLHFMTKEEVQRMRAEMRQHCSRRQQEQARRRAPTGGDCPLLLSERMLRILEFAFRKRLATSRLSSDDSMNALQLRDPVAQAAASLIFHHRFSPACVLQFLDDVSQLARNDYSAHELYTTLLETMVKEMRDNMPSVVELTRPPDARLPAVVPIGAGGSAANVLGPPATLARAETMQARPARSLATGVWFGEGNNSTTPCTINRKINMTDLPIYQKKQHIMDTVHDNRLVLLQGETGSGKTTQVPQYILESLVNGVRSGARIVCTQPRRIAAITVAKRVADELGEVVGEGLVGYKIRGVSVMSPRCKILFCTTGVLLRRIANEGQDDMFSPNTMTHLIVDEIHERGCEADFMLTFLRQVIEHRPKLHVVLMSATMDAECFLRYFKMGDAPPPPLLMVSGRCYPTHQVFLDSINVTLGRSTSNEAMSFDALRQGSPQNLSENEGIDYELIFDILKEIDASDKGAWHFVNDKDGTVPDDVSEGAVLIFLPGAGEITQLLATIEELGAPDHWWVIPLHGALPTEEQQDAFRTTLPAGKTWKVIACTNVAETSVTVPDVTVVIDSCRERRTGIDKFSNTPQLKEQFCAQDSLMQRRGRAGRVRPGVCLRLISEKKMESLDTKTPPEIQRVPLENIYLLCCACGIEDQAAFLAKTPDPPEDASVQFARAMLADMGALDTASADGLTPLGRHLANMPCHPRLGKIVILGCLLRVPGPVIDICAAMSGRSPMRTTQDTAKRSAWQAERQKLLKELGHKSDHCVWAVLLQLWRSEGVVRRDLCNTYGLSYERMSAAWFERKHLVESLTQAGFLPEGFLQAERESEATAPVPDWTVVRAAISGGLFPNVVRVEKTAQKNPGSSADVGDRNKFMRYSFLQRQINGGENTGYPKSCNMHPNSICFGQDNFDCPLLVFYTIQQTTKLYVYDVSEVCPWALLLFGSQPVWNESNRTIEVGGWSRFHCTHKEPIWTVVNTARSMVQAVLSRKATDVAYDPATSSELAACIELIRTWGLGFESCADAPTWPFLEEFREMGESEALDHAEKRALEEANV